MWNSYNDRLPSVSIVDNFHGAKPVEIRSLAAEYACISRRDQASVFRLMHEPNCSHGLLMLLGFWAEMPDLQVDLFDVFREGEQCVYIHALAGTIREAADSDSELICIPCSTEGCDTHPCLHDACQLALQRCKILVAAERNGHQLENYAYPASFPYVYSVSADQHLAPGEIRRRPNNHFLTKAIGFPFEGCDDGSNCGALITFVLYLIRIMAPYVGKGLCREEQQSVVARQLDMLPQTASVSHGDGQNQH